MKASWAGARNILCVRLDSMGDVLMTTPALRALKSLCPTPRLTLWTSNSGAAVAALVPEIDAVVTHSAPWVKSPEAPDPDADLAITARLACAEFDAAVIFTVYSQSALPAALLCHLAGIPRRLAHCRENPYRLLTDWVPETEPHERVRHEAQRQLDLVESVGATTLDPSYSLRVPRTALRRARQLLRDSGVRATRPWLSIHPGASAPSRRYPPESFAEVGRLLARRGWQVVLLGEQRERELVARIQRDMRMLSHAITGRSLEELAALISLSPLLVANNSGPAHIAAAVGTPLVDLYALTNPQHTPWHVPHRLLSCDVPCRNCYKSLCPQGHHACLRGVSPEAVVAAVEDLRASQLPRRPDVSRLLHIVRGLEG